MKKAFRAAAIAAILLFALTFIGSAKIKSTSAHLLFSSSVSAGAMNRGKSRSKATTE